MTLGWCLASVSCLCVGHKNTPDRLPTTGDVINQGPQLGPSEILTQVCPEVLLPTGYGQSMTEQARTLRQNRIWETDFSNNQLRLQDSLMALEPSWAVAYTSLGPSPSFPSSLGPVLDQGLTFHPDATSISLLSLIGISPHKILIHLIPHWPILLKEHRLIHFIMFPRLQFLLILPFKLFPWSNNWFPQTPSSSWKIFLLLLIFTSFRIPK